MFLNVSGTEVELPDAKAAQSVLLEGLGSDGLGSSEDERVPLPCALSAFQAWAAGVESAEKSVSFLFEVIKVCR